MKKKTNRVRFLLLTLIIGTIIPFILPNNYYYNENDKNSDMIFDESDLIIHPSATSASNWWNPAYKYRKMINITNNEVSILPSGYTVNISVDTANLITYGKLRTDGNDLRIAWYNSVSKTWFELDRINKTNFNTGNTQILFKTQTTINPLSEDTNYYLYYGNPEATNPPINKNNILDVYDDFTQSNGPAEGWNNLSNSWYVINNEYRENSTSIDQRSILNSYTVENASIEVCVKNNGISFGAGILFRYIDSTNFYCAGIGFWDKEISYGKRNTTSWYELAYYGADESNLVPDQWYDLRADFIGSNHKIYLDNVLRINYDDSDHLTAAQIGFLTYTNLSSYFDDLQIRLLVSTEPSLTVGMEEIYRPSTNDFNYYKLITIDCTKVSGLNNLTDFPVLLSFFDLDLYNDVQPDGDDIIFSDGNNWLDHEIELFNQNYNLTHAQLIAWVRIPSLSSSVDTNIIMYYGNSTMGSQENPTGVWDNNYESVYHLHDDFLDSTTNNRDGTNTGSIDATGRMGDGQDFEHDDGSDNINIGTWSVSGSMITIQAWVKYESFDSSWSGFSDARILSKNNGTSDGSEHHVWMLGTYNQSLDENGPYNLRGRIKNGTDDAIGTTTVEAPLGDLSVNTWYLTTIKYDGSNIYLVLDGNTVIAQNKTGSLRINNWPITIGNSPTGNRPIDAIIDEVRVSSTIRSNNWLRTEYNNQYEPNSFYSIGKEYTTLTHPPNAEYFKYYKEITIDQTKINGSENLINFPVLISILDSDLHDDTQSNGSDIAFSLNNIWLDHEIEYFNQTYSDTHAKLVAWVRVPSLSPSTDTKIKMYYGNSTMNSRQNATGVWDANYIGVWHLSEDPSGIIYDSTSYNNDGTSNGTIDQVNGIIDGSLNFNGANDYIDCGNDNSLDITENITIEHWIKGNDFSNDPDTLTKGTYQESYSLWILDTGTVTLELNNETFESNSPISTGVWNFITCTYNGNTRKIFINGTVDNSGPYSTPIEIVSGPLTISTDPWSFDGIIDEIRISNIVRSPDWIETQYNNQHDPGTFYSIGTENQVEEDTSAPDITIDSPNPNDLFGSSAPDYDLTVTDANLDSIWYSLDGGTTNSTTVNMTGTINLGMWSAQPNGTVTIRFYANDTMGNVNYEEVTVRKDINAPVIGITSPNPNDLFGSSAPDYDLTVTDGNLYSIWYSLDGGTTNSTAVAATGTIDPTMWSAQPNGTVTIRFYAEDSAGNIAWQEVTVRKDIDPPTLNIIEPNNYDLFGTTAPDFDVTISDSSGISTQWYTIDGGTTNYTFVGSTGPINQAAWNGQGNGTVTIRFYAEDSAGNIAWQEVTVRKDIDPPTLNIIEPNNYDLFGSTPPDITININDSNLDESWYQLDNGTIITNNYTWTGFIAQSVWDQVGNGTVIIRFYANDTLGNLGTSEVIVYKDIFFPIITINSPNFNDAFNSSAPNFIVSISGSNLDTRWYSLDNGLSNYTFTGLTGTIDQLAWDAQGDGTVTIKFSINNTLGVIGFDEASVIKDTLVPLITINLPSNNTYCGIAPIINILATDANLDTIWYKVNTTNILLGNNINQQLDASIWNSLPEGEFYVYIYANDSVSHLSDPIMLTLYKDTIAPSAPELISFPQGEVSGTLTFEWQEGSDPSGISKYRLIIDNEANPFATPGFVFEINITGSYYEYTGSLQPGTHHFFLYQIDGAGHQSPASTGTFSIRSSPQPSPPSEFPLWIIIVIIGVAIGGVVGFVVLKKSKSKKVIPAQISKKQPVPKRKLEVREELKLLDYEALKDKSRGELNAREKKLIVYVKYLEENKDYTKAAEFVGELIIIEEILANPIKAKSYRQKQIDIAIKGLDYLKDQYEIESKNAAISGDYSKAIELYKESKLISDNLKIYVESQENSNTEEDVILETKEPQMLMGEVEIVYSCINDLLTKYFDEIGIKYYSNPQIFDKVQNQIHGLILTDNKLLIADIDPSIRDKIKSIQIIYTEDISNENVIKLCKNFQNPYVVLIIVGIKWPKNIEAQTIEIIQDDRIKYKENIRIIHYELFSTLIGLKDDYEGAFNEIIDLYNKSELDILREIHESSEIIIHSTDELLYDLKEKGLINHKLKEYFHK